MRVMNLKSCMARRRLMDVYVANMKGKDGEEGMVFDTRNELLININGTGTFERKAAMDESSEHALFWAKRRQ